MSLQQLRDQLRLPVISAPMFIVSQPALVIAQCTSGIVGSFPALNARPAEQLDQWLSDIQAALADYQQCHPDQQVAPFAVNLIVHPSNQRLEADLATLVRHRVPLVITSLHAPDKVVEAVHSYGGSVLHDVTTVRHAQRAIKADVDGLILVSAGAGGHGGRLSPFALVNEVRTFYSGPLALAGAISHGGDIVAAQAMGADFAYMGTRFLAANEAHTDERYRRMLIEAQAADIVYTPLFTGVPGNYLAASIRDSGLDPDALPDQAPESLSLGNSRAKAWKNILGAGQGVGSIQQCQPLGEIVDALEVEFEEAAARLTQRRVDE
ncbi:NAD(P)H-dependent flavin oxidoreductase [Carnimonas bestiolae]|uniref:NAD(P)H-dependent flavin oxidoreductase n=1 Tax=Carnimonas bestiolae TaxID=3402172 RepID=UPI003EDB8D27